MAACLRDALDFQFEVIDFGMVGGVNCRLENDFLESRIRRNGLDTQHILIEPLVYTSVGKVIEGVHACGSEAEGDIE